MFLNSSFGSSHKNSANGVGKLKTTKESPPARIPYSENVQKARHVPPCLSPKDTDALGENERVFCRNLTIVISSSHVTGTAPDGVGRSRQEGGRAKESQVDALVASRRWLERIGLDVS
jgi:hypothetical protein